MANKFFNTCWHGSLRHTVLFQTQQFSMDDDKTLGNEALGNEALGNEALGSERMASRHTRHADVLLSRLSALRQEDRRGQGALVDMVLSFGPGAEPLPMHCLVGMACSDFIYVRLTGTRAWGKTTTLWNGRQVRCVELRLGSAPGEVPAAGLRKLVDFWYSGELELSREPEQGVREALDVFTAASYMLAWEGVAELCRAHLSACATPATWVALFNVGDLGILGFSDAVRAAALAFAGRMFRSVVAHASWAQAPLLAVEMLFRELRTAKEDEVLLAGLAWAAPAHLGCMPQLLRSVRLPHVTPMALQHLKSVLDSSVLDADVGLECSALLDQAAAWNPDTPDPPWRLWTPRCATSALIVVGYNRAMRYEARASRWVSLPAPPAEASDGAVVVAVGPFIYAAGGRRENDTLTQVCVLNLGPDPATAASASATAAADAGAHLLAGWAYSEPMGVARWCAAGAELNGALYVAGGFIPGIDNDEIMSSMERFCPRTNEWTAVAGMSVPRGGHQMVAMGGFVYAIGGCFSCDPSGYWATATAERYDPGSNTWTPIASMADIREMFAAAAMDGFLYVVGGREQNDNNDVPVVVKRSCERYNPATNTWSRIADLPEERYGLALACLDGALYAVGGLNWARLPSTTPPWRYDPEHDAWTETRLEAGGEGVYVDHYSGYASV
jgi:hypothetical protein